jgi:hypothetical protein
VKAMRQKNQIDLNLGTRADGEARSAAAQATEARTAKACLERPAVAGPSMEAVIEHDNLKKALAQVKRNEGAAGVDGMTVGELPAYLKEQACGRRQIHGAVEQSVDLVDSSSSSRVMACQFPAGNFRPVRTPSIGWWRVGAS